VVVYAIFTRRAAQCDALRPKPHNWRFWKIPVPFLGACGGDDAMQIALLPYEGRTLKALAVKFSLERELTVGIAEDLNLLARLFERVVSCPEPEFKAGRVVIMGLINHMHYLLIGGLQAVEVGNVAVWSACARGLIETFGACVLISERPGTAPNYLEQVSAGKLYTAAARAHPKFGGDIKRLHQIVHPASGAIFAGSTPIDEEKKTALFHFGLRSPSASDGREGVIFLGNLATSIVKQFSVLVSNDDVLSAGKVIMDRSSKV
jgi:hypothetical protein